MSCNTVAFLFLLCFVVLETSILVNFYLTAVFPHSRDNTLSSVETKRLFNSYDTNGDGVIDLWEFEAVRQRISESLQTEPEILVSDIEIDSKFEELKTTEGEILDLKTEFTPLDLNSMSKFKDDQYSNEDLRCLKGLKQWQNVLKPNTSFAVEVFKGFLPKRKSIDIGEPWMVVAPDMSRYGSGLSSNRYTPSVIAGDQAVLHYLLQMFHPRPFINSRFPPQGTVACIRAENKEFLDIEFRIHAEFQLNKPPLLPFWFSPAQFSGKLVISRNGSHIEMFEMEVPNNKSLNVDMEWLTGTKSENEEREEIKQGEAAEHEQMNMEVDIGYLPKMRLQAIGPSYTSSEEAPIQNKEHHINWEKEMSRDEARSILEKKMYPFKKVPYLSFDKAYVKAAEEKKLVHSILLCGALDDQSC